MTNRRTGRSIVAVAILLAVGLILLLISLGLYVFQTATIPSNVITVLTPKAYVESGLFTRVAYLQYSVTPNRAKAEVVYQISVQSGAVTKQDKVIWTELELDIGKPKLFKHKLSQDEYTAIQRHGITTTTSEIQSTRDINYFIIPIFYGLLVTLCAVLVRERHRPTYPQQPDHQATTPTLLAAPTETDILSDTDQLKLCFQCSSLKSYGGTLRCDRQRCKHQSKSQTVSSPPINLPELTQPPKVSKIGLTPQVFVIGLLTAFTGFWAVVFLTLISKGTDGAVSFAEPDRLILWVEFFLATGLTLAGVILCVLKLKEMYHTP